MSRYLILLLPLLLLVTACSSGTRTSWQLTAAPADGDVSLQAVVPVGGCDDFDRFEVKETNDSVIVGAYVLQNVRSTCNLSIGKQKETITLSRPLGNRRLQSCNPPSPLYGNIFGNLSDDDCRSPILGSGLN